MHVHRISDKFRILLVGLISLAGIFFLPAPTAAYADGGSITITGDGVNNPGVTFTRDELRNPDVLPQYTELYSTINTWPNKSWYGGTGVKVYDLLDAAGGLKPGATLIKFSSSDGFKATFTVQEFVHDPRYSFPHFMDTGTAGHVPGDPAEAVAVEPIIAWKSCSGQDLDAVTEDKMVSDDANHLLFGQRAVTEQTAPLFAKYVVEIEVLTSAPGKWDQPQANPDSGTVPAGTLVRLTNSNMDQDKIHYTTDGSTPTIDSPIYNSIAKRWWSSRGEETVAEINHPIQITKGTTIKAITIGPGKLNSNVATFIYKVVEASPNAAGLVTPQMINLIIGEMAAKVNGIIYPLDAAPYVDTRTGRTLVPVRFISEFLGAEVEWLPESGQVRIKDGDKEIILTLGSRDVMVNDVKQIIDSAPTTLPPGRTYTPLRFVSETLGTQVDYEAETREVTIFR